MAHKQQEKISLTKLSKMLIIINNRLVQLVFTGELTLKKHSTKSTQELSFFCHFFTPGFDLTESNKRVPTLSDEVVIQVLTI